jgi:O26-antigen biosynthesis N-acetyl-L-fucosamine transferase
MRYLIVSDCFYPSKKSISRHIFDLLKEFSGKNKIVDFYFPAKFEDKLVYKKKYSLKNINYYPITSNDIKKNNLLTRGLSEFLMPFKFWNQIKKNQNKIEKVLIFSPSIFFGLIIKKIKLKFKCKIILIVRDIFPDWVLQKNIFLWLNPLFIFAKILSNLQYHFSDIIAVQSIEDNKIISKKYNYKIVKTLYNWITPEKIKFNRNLNKKKNIKNFVFAGTIGPAQNWNNIINLINKLNEKKLFFNFYFVGDGKYKPFLKKKLFFCKNVFFVKSLPEKKFLNFLTKMDVGVISLDHNIKFNNIPGKFFSYLETNLPILLDASYSQEISKIINNFKIGLTNKNSKNNLFHNSKLFIENKFNFKNMKKNYSEVMKKKFSTKIAYKKISNF